MNTSETVAAGQLRAFIERIERLEEEKKGNYILDSLLAQNRPETY